MGDANRRVRLVDVLSARPGGTKRVDLEVARVNLDGVDRVHFRQHRDGTSRGMDATLRFGFRHSLHPMRARLELEAGVRALPNHARDDLAESTVLAFAGVDDFDPPA